jgi:hypothetical protein
MTPAILRSATAPANTKAMPAAQPQSTVIAIQTASTAAMIAPRLHTALGSVSAARALRQPNRTHPGSVNPIGCAKTAICRPDRLYAPHTVSVRRALVVISSAYS